MLRSERAATRVASLRATRALASRRGDLARLKIGVPAFVEALWALVAPDARAARVSDSDATADPPDGAADADGESGAEADEHEEHHDQHERHPRPRRQRDEAKSVPRDHPYLARSLPYQAD